MLLKILLVRSKTMMTRTMLDKGTMNSVVSKDGTRIAFDVSGKGPALILVGGAFEQRAFDSETSQLAALPLLSERFTVYHYDRRGRGDSTDTLPYAVEREVEDIGALIAQAGGSVYLYGISSGAAFAFQAALALSNNVKKLALYEPPYNDDAEARKRWNEYYKAVRRAGEEGRKREAVELFMGLMGVTPEQLEEMHQYPQWSQWEGIGQTLAYEAEALGEEAAVPRQAASQLRVPTLVMAGSESYPFMLTTAEALAKTIPNGEYRRLEGQTHEVRAEAIGPVLVEWFS
jgi:pimeloyl-ACP methyl ester carboxylesterase